MLLCKDCKHYGYWSCKCSTPSGPEWELNPVTGNRPRLYAVTRRNAKNKYGTCGPEAKLFERRRSVPVPVDRSEYGLHLLIAAWVGLLLGTLLGPLLRYLWP